MALGSLNLFLGGKPITTQPPILTGKFEKMGWRPSSSGPWDRPAHKSCEEEVEADIL